MNAAAGFRALVRRDITVAMRNSTDSYNSHLFLILAVMLFPLSFGPEAGLLERAAPGLIWVATILAALLSLDQVFRHDYEDGSLDQLILHLPLPVVVYAKVLTHWLVSGLPVLVLAPVLGSMLGMNGPAIWMLMASLALGTPVLSLVGTIGVALTVTRNNGGALRSLLILPLYIPVLIFGTTLVDQAASGLPYSAHFYVLAALLILSLTLAPIAASSALRISME